MLQRELNSLMSQWKKIKRKTHFQKAPSLVNRESGLTRGLVRDIFSDKVDSLAVDSKQVFNEIVGYLKDIAPELIERVKPTSHSFHCSTPQESSPRSAISSSAAATRHRAAT